MNSELFSDIETIPSQDKAMVDLHMSKFTHPGNMSKQETIDNFMNDPININKHMKKMSLDPLLGQIFCIGFAIGDGELMSLKALNFEEEKEMLKDFRGILRPNGKQLTLVGHYFRKFDAPYISKRMMIHGLGPLFPFGTKPWDQQIDDTYEMFSAGSDKSASLDSMCKAFNLPSPKDGFDGSMVAQAFIDGEYDRITNYCEDDVDCDRNCYHYMKTR